MHNIQEWTKSPDFYPFYCLYLVPSNFIVYQPTKRKNDPSRRNAQPPTDTNTNQGFREVLDSSFRTPVSRKCGMGHRASSTSCDVPDPQTPLPLNGEHFSLLFIVIVLTVKE